MSKYNAFNKPLLWEENFTRFSEKNQGKKIGVITWHQDAKIISYNFNGRSS